MDLGARINVWRRHRKLSQRRLAALVGVTPQAVCMWEKPSKYDNVPSTRNLAKVIEALGVSMTRFYGPLPKLPKVAA